MSNLSPCGRSAGLRPAGTPGSRRPSGGRRTSRRDGGAPRLFALLALFVATTSAAQSVILNSPGKKGSFAIQNATIYPVTSAPIANGTIVFANGVITTLGANVSVPAGATLIDGTGLSVYPGLIDSGTNVGITEIDSVPGTVDTAELGEFNPNARADVAVNPHSNVIPVTRVNGVTTVLTEPEGGIISGQSALLQLAGWTSKEMTLKAPVGMHIRFPRVRTPAFSEQPQEEEAEKEARKSYTKELDRLGDLFRDAQAYAKAAGARGQSPAVRRFDRDVILEALVPVVEGRLPAIIHARRVRDIRAAIEFADQFKIKMILADGDDVTRVIPELKKRDIPVLLGPILALPPREDDPYDMLFTNASALHAAGVRFAIQTREAHLSRNLPYHAAACAAFGLPKDVALKAVTIYPAQIFGVADRVGSLEVGKIANIIVTTGDPLEVVTNVRRLFIGGEDIPLDSLHTLLYEKFRQRP